MNSYSFIWNKSQLRHFATFRHIKPLWFRSVYSFDILFSAQQGLYWPRCFENFLYEFVTVTSHEHRGVSKNRNHDDVIKWKHFPRCWPFVRGIHRSPVNIPRKGQWRGALMFSLICAWIKSWVNSCGADDLRRHRAHYDVTVMINCLLNCLFRL